MSEKITDIVKLNNEELTTLLHTPGAPAIKSPFEKTIFLMETHVAGTTHLKTDLKSLEAKLKKGYRLNFFLEKNNPHDEFAIIIKDSDNVKVGYVPRDKNELLARLMDAGKLIYGKVQNSELKNKWLKINMEIYLDD
ncbi:MAG: HIRAN domain-containing protein [Deltaproteobacteria bacterium]|jgi:hypothetical protein|nr:HIRAN domain-containing protein [Deltaproteobacteria bacterium]